MPVSLKAPEGCTGAGIGQIELVPDENGLVWVPDGVDYSELLNHGFTPCSEAGLAQQRLKGANADEERTENEVQRRVAERLKDLGFFDKTPLSVINAASAPAEMKGKIKTELEQAGTDAVRSAD